MCVKAQQKAEFMQQAGIHQVNVLDIYNPCHGYTFH